MNPVRAKHRLPSECYKGIICCSFTCCIKQHTRLFVEDSLFCLFERELIRELLYSDIDAHVYLFMPDHVHLLLQGKSNTSDLSDIIKRFKQKTGFWLSKNKPEVAWQKDYFDHILREEENIEKHVRYILRNPVRAGLINDWKIYPYKGSTVYDFEKWE